MPDIAFDYENSLGGRCPCSQGKLVLKKSPGGSIVLACEANNRHFRFATDTEEQKFNNAGRYLAGRWPKGYVVTA